MLPGTMRWLIVATFIVSLFWLVTCEMGQVSKIIVFLYLLSAGQRRGSENKAWEAAGHRREDN